MFFPSSRENLETHEVASATSGSREQRSRYLFPERITEPAILAKIVVVVVAFFAVGFAARKEIGLISDFEREEMRPGCCEDRFRFPDSSLLSSFAEIEPPDEVPAGGFEEGSEIAEYRIVDY